MTSHTTWFWFASITSRAGDVSPAFLDYVKNIIGVCEGKANTKGHMLFIREKFNNDLYRVLFIEAVRFYLEGCLGHPIDHYEFKGDLLIVYYFMQGNQRGSNLWFSQKKIVHGNLITQIKNGSW